MRRIPSEMSAAGSTGNTLEWYDFAISMTAKDAYDDNPVGDVVAEPPNGSGGCRFRFG
jgi:hypothetical protein